MSQTITFEKVEQQPDRSFFSARYRNDAFDCPYSYHPEIEVDYFEKGQCTMVIGDVPTKMDEGDLLVIGPNTPHYIEDNPTRVTNPAGVVLSLIQFNKDIFSRFFSENVEFTDAKLFLDGLSGSAFKVSGSTCSEVRKRLLSIIEAEPMRGMVDLLEIICALTQSDDKDFERITSTASIKPSHTVEIQRLERFFHYVDQNIGKQIRLPEAAEIAGMAPSSFSRFFHDKTGQRFQDFIIRKRISSACIQLIDTEYSVTEIAFACGFNNLSNFNRHFRKQKRTSPMAYRKKWKHQTSPQ